MAVGFRLPLTIGNEARRNVEPERFCRLEIAPERLIISGSGVYSRVCGQMSATSAGKRRGVEPMLGATVIKLPCQHDLAPGDLQGAAPCAIITIGIATEPSAVIGATWPDKRQAPGPFPAVRRMIGREIEGEEIVRSVQQRKAGHDHRSDQRKRHDDRQRQDSGHDQQRAQGGGDDTSEAVETHALSFRGVETTKPATVK